MSDPVSISDPTYLRSGYVPSVTFSTPNGQKVSAPDFLDQGYQSAMALPNSGGDFSKPGNLPLTTLLEASPAFGNTSCYWLLLARNGIVSYQGIREGTSLTAINIQGMSAVNQYQGHSLTNPTPTLTQMSI